MDPICQAPDLPSNRDGRAPTRALGLRPTIKDEGGDAITGT